MVGRATAGRQVAEPPCGLCWRHGGGPCRVRIQLSRTVTFTQNGAVRCCGQGDEDRSGSRGPSTADDARIYERKRWSNRSGSGGGSGSSSGDLLLVPCRCCLPRHRMPCRKRSAENQGSKCEAKTRRALSAKTYLLRDCFRVVVVSQISQGDSGGGGGGCILLGICRRFNRGPRV